MKNNNSKKNKLFEKTLDSISNRKKAPIYSYVILLLLYIATSAIVTMSAGSKTAVSILGTEVALYTFAGVFSALSNICIIFMTLYHGKLGFFTSLAVLTVQIPMIISGIVFRQNLSSLPGLVTDLFTIISIIVIFDYRDLSQTFSR